MLDAMDTTDASSAPDTGELRARRSRELTDTISLVRRFQSGDVQALDTLFARYYPRVLRCVKLRMGALVKRYYEPEDVVQRVFAAAMEDLQTVEIREPGELIHWLATVSENQIRGIHDYLTAKKRDVRLERSLDRIRGAISSGSFRFDPADDDTLQLEILSRQELAGLVDQCLAELSEDHRQVILLRNIAGCSWELVAEKMGRETASAACMLHARARVALLKKLRPHLKGLDEEGRG